jgi:hypothetical protein
VIAVADHSALSDQERRIVYDCGTDFFGNVLEEIELPVEGDDIVEDEEDAFADEQGTNVASEDNLSADTTLNDNVETEK